MSRIPRKYRRNERPVLVKHASGSRALVRARFDMRSTVGKAYRQSVDELVHHLGGPGEVSTVERRLIDNASRVLALKLLALDEMNRTGAFRDGAPTAAHEAYRRAIAEESAMLRSLGVTRRAKNVPALADYIASKGKTRRLAGSDTSDAEERENDD